jgi:hypothetical protein
MKRMMRLLAWALCGALGGAAVFAAEPAAEAPLVPVAHSAQLSVEGAVTGEVLTLRVHRANDAQPLKVTDLAVRLDGRTLPVMARADGSFAAPLKEVPAHAPGKLEIIIAHDGALDALDGQLPASAPAAAGAGSGGTLSSLIHKQMSWWILNVVIVLVGVVAVSRRMS